MAGMDKSCSLHDAVARDVENGMSVAMGCGLESLNPSAIRSTTGSLRARLSNASRSSFSSARLIVLVVVQVRDFALARWSEFAMPPRVAECVSLPLLSHAAGVENDARPQTLLVPLVSSGRDTSL